MTCKSKRHIHKEKIRTAEIKRGRAGSKGNSRIGTAGLEQWYPVLHRKKKENPCVTPNPTFREPAGTPGKTFSSEQFSTDLLPISWSDAFAFHAIKELCLHRFPGISQRMLGLHSWWEGDAFAASSSRAPAACTHSPAGRELSLETGTKPDCHRALPSFNKHCSVW